MSHTLRAFLSYIAISLLLILGSSICLGIWRASSESWGAIAPYTIDSILLIVVLWILFRLTRSASLSFLCAGVLGVVIIGSSPLEYSETIRQKAGETIVFLSLLFGGLVTLASQPQLSQRLKSLQAARATERTDSCEELATLRRHIAVFCLTDRLRPVIHSASGFFWWLHPLNLIRFVALLLPGFPSSAVAAMVYRSLWARPGFGAVDKPEDQKTGAGILCLCISGPLLFFFGLPSVWWLFFEQQLTSAGGQKFVNAYLPTVPIGVLIFGFGSAVHGFWLLHKGGTLARSVQHGELAPGEKEDQALYGWLVLSLFAAFLILLAAAEFAHASNQPTGVDLAVPTPADVSNRWAVTISGLILLVLCSAQFLMLKFHYGLAWDTKAYWERVVDGMRQPLGVAIFLVVFLAFNELLREHFQELKGFLKVDTAAEPSAMGFAFGAILVVAVAGALGYALGTNFGAYGIATAILVLLPIPVSQWGRPLLECIILITSWSNIYSPNSVNLMILLGDKYHGAERVSRIWRVDSVGKFSAQCIQGMLLVVALVTGIVFHSF